MLAFLAVDLQTFIELDVWLLSREKSSGSRVGASCVLKNLRKLHVSGAISGSLWRLFIS